MNFKGKVLKKVISILCAISISTSFAITSAGAINTTEAEIAFSEQYMNSLPKPGEADFDRFSGEYERGKMQIKDKFYIDTLEDARGYDVKYPSNENNYNMENNARGEEEKVYDSYNIVRDTINEKEVYNQIKQRVEKLKEKVNERTPDNDANIDSIKSGIESKKISKHYNMPYKMRLAKAIYRWVANKIPYDFDSLAKGKNLKTGEKQSLRKPQDPFYVFAKKKGVCAGKANLLNLMMRLAGIPSVVVISNTHAFNAVYLKDETNNREGWILLDATWGAPKSDKSLQTGIEENNDNANKEKEKINPMIKGIAKMSYPFMRENFAMDDDYAKTINDMIYIHLYDREKMSDDAEIDKFNKDIEKKLNELNANNSGKNGFKLKKIKIVKDKDGKCLVEYETNVHQDEAEELHKQVQEEITKNKANDMLNKENEQFAENDFKELKKHFCEKIDSINKLHNRNRSKLKQAEKYSKEFKAICDNLIQEHRNELINNINLMAQYEKDKNNHNYQESKEKTKHIIDDMNQEITSNIKILNEKYPDIVTIKNFEITFNEYNLNVINVATTIKAKMQFNLPLNEAIQDIEKQAMWSDAKEFFFGFYDKTLAFKYANENIINWNAHKINEMVFGNWHDRREDNSVFDLKIDGITYKMQGFEGNKHYELIGNKEKPLENVKISLDVANSNIPIKIGCGIKSLTLQGNEEITIGYNSNLESIDASKSTKYFSDEFALYEKNEDGSKGNIKHIFKKEDFNGIKLHIDEEKNNGQIKITGIEIYGSDKCHENVELPKFLTQFNIPIKIGYGIKSLILQGNEEITIDHISNLESIDASKSTKYFSDELALYEKNEDGSKGNIKHIFKKEDFNGIKLNINKKENDGQIKITGIEIYDFILDLDKCHENVKLPKFLTQFNIPIKIGFGIKSLILEDDDIVDLSEARALERVYINKSNKYMVENGVLYEKDKNGKKGNKVKMYNGIEVIDNTDKEDTTNVQN